MVDVDLERFFDRVNRDVLMGKLETQIGDRRLLRIIRRYLEAGIMVQGVAVSGTRGRRRAARSRRWARQFLGYSFWVAAGGAVRRRGAAKALNELRQRVRQVTRRNGGRCLEQVTEALGTFLRGWREYFQLVDTPRIFADLDGWIHGRLRALQLKPWKRGRTPFREWIARGLPEWLVVKGAGHTAVPYPD